jgi:thiamine transporter ThiT
MIPIQVSSWFRQILAMLGLINTFGLTILIFNYKWVDEIKSKIVKGLIWGLVVLVVGHNFIWTSIQLNIADYKDDEIIIIDKVDQRRKTITQHRDDGVFGDYIER